MFRNQPEIFTVSCLCRIRIWACSKSMSVPDLFKNYILLQCVKEKLIQVRALKNRVQIQVKKKPNRSLFKTRNRILAKANCFRMWPIWRKKSWSGTELVNKPWSSSKFASVAEGERMFPMPCIPAGIDNRVYTHTHATRRSPLSWKSLELL